MRGGRDARRAMDVDADVPLAGDDRLARVHADADADRARFERVATRGGGCHRVGRASEGDEERIALRVDLDARVPLEYVAECTPVLCEQIGVPGAVLVEQARRPLDVGEEERDRAPRQLAHRRIFPCHNTLGQRLYIVHLLVNSKSELDRSFVALAHPARRSIVEHLVAGPASVGQAARGLGITKPAVTKHLKVLEEAGIVTRTVSGRTHVLRLEPRSLREASDWIELHRSLWEAKFEAVERHLAESQRKESGQR